MRRMSHRILRAGSASMSNPILYARLKDERILRKICRLSATTGQPMREVVERLLRFALTSDSLVIPKKFTAAEEAHQRRVERLKRRAAG